MRTSPSVFGLLVMGARLATVASEHSRDEGGGGGGSSSEEKKPIKILVVDDDYDIHDALRLAFDDSNHAHTVMDSMNGSDALAAMKAWHPDVVFLDIRMPTMDGLALRQEMFRDKNLNDVYVVVITGKSMSTEELQALMADEYLPKPMSLDKIHEILDTVVQRKIDPTLRRELRIKANIARLRTLRHEIDEMIDDEEVDLRNLRGKKDT